jgi:hypothetical protein
VVHVAHALMRQWCIMFDRLPPRAKRYGWLRIYNGFWDHATWKAVARLAQIHVTVVQRVVGKLLECGNKGRPRGSIADFSILETAVALDLETRTSSASMAPSKGSVGLT